MRQLGHTSVQVRDLGAQAPLTFAVLLSFGHGLLEGFELAVGLGQLAGHPAPRVGELRFEALHLRNRRRGQLLEPRAGGGQFGLQQLALLCARALEALYARARGLKLGPEALTLSGDFLAGRGPAFELGTRQFLQPAACLGQLGLQLRTLLAPLRFDALKALSRVGQLPLQPCALGCACGLHLLEARLRLGQLRVQGASGFLDAPCSGRLGQGALEARQPTVHLVDPLAEPALLREGGLERAHLVACLLQLRAQPFLGLGRARHIAPKALHRRAHLVELAAQAPALALRLLRFALLAVAIGPRLLLASAAGVLEIAAQAVHLGARLFEHGARVRQLGFEPRLGLLEAGEPLLGLSGLGARDFGLLARRLELGGGVLQGPLDGTFGREILVLERGIGRCFVERAKGDDRACRQAFVVKVGVALQGCLDPVHDSAVTASQRGKGISPRSRDLESLEEAVELEALAHAHRYECHRHLELVAVLAADHRLQLPTTGRQRVREAQSLHQGTPEHPRGRPAEQLLGGPAPARYRTVAIGENEAGVHELAEQLFDCFGGGEVLLRAGEVRGEGVVGHRGSLVGRPFVQSPRSSTTDCPTCV